MSRAPWVMEKPEKAFAKPGAVFDTSIGWRFTNPAFLSGELSRGGKASFSMPETAEEVARVYGTSRQDCDAFAVASHERALAAIQAGRFAQEIVPVTVTGRRGAQSVVDTDEGPRPRAAEILGIGRTTLYRKMRALKIDADERMTAPGA